MAAGGRQRRTPLPFCLLIVFLLAAPLWQPPYGRSRADRFFAADPAPHHLARAPSFAAAAATHIVRDRWDLALVGVRSRLPTTLRGGGSLVEGDEEKLRRNLQVMFEQPET